MAAIEARCVALEALGLAGASITDEGLGHVIAALGTTTRTTTKTTTKRGASSPRSDDVVLSGGKMNHGGGERVKVERAGLTSVEVEGCRGLSRSTRQAALEGGPLAILAAIRKGGHAIRL